MPSMRPSALAVAIALHGALIAFVVSGKPPKPHTEVEPPPVIVQLLTPVPPPKPEPPPPEPPKPKPPKPEPVKPQPRPEPPRSEQPKPEPTKPEIRPEPRPEPAKIEPPPAPAAAPQPAPVAPPAPPAPPPPPPTPSVAKASARTEVSISASYAVANRKPEYPKMSLRFGEQGTVVLMVMVKSDGSAGDVEVKSTSGFTRLDRAAADAVKTWRFNPATVDGKAVDKSYEVPITFKPPN